MLNLSNQIYFGNRCNPSLCAKDLDETCAESKSFSKEDKIEEPFIGGKLNPDLKKRLDNAEFTFELEGEQPEKMTIKEAVQKSIRRTDNHAEISAYHATFTKENAQSILYKGFDPKRISRTYYGPGFYFTPGMGDALNYGSATLEGKLVGRLAVMNGRYYERIANKDVRNFIKENTGAKNDSEDIINEYVRNLFTNELNIDLAYGASRGGGAYVVFNPEAIKNLHLA